MARVTILAGDADERIGSFEFDQLPRVHEEVVIPWASDKYGTRVFTVREVVHLAFGAPDEPYGAGTCTVLRTDEVL